MDRRALIPAPHAAERLFLLDVLAGRIPDAQFGRDIGAEAFLAITPEKLYPMVYVRLRAHTDRVPPEVLQTLAAHHRKNLLLELRRAADLKRIDAALGAAGIGFLILKGPVLAAMVYPERAARTMLDLDLLLAQEDFAPAIAALETIGYRVPRQFAGASLFAGDAPPLVHDDPGGAVLELHTMLDSLPEQRDAYAAIAPHARNVDLGHGVVLQALDREEFFAHVVLHVSKHHRFEDELRSLLDVALLMHADADRLDWIALDREWQQRGIADWIALTVTLAHILLDSPLPPVYRDRPPSDEVLTLAAEQLWAAKNRVPTRITYTIAGTPSPIHATVPGETVPTPRGVEGLRARADREWQRVRRLASAIRKGTIQPGIVAADVELHRRRERMFKLVEKKSEG
jgi:Uncharacterised nucleotidyltransferase